MRRRRRVVTGLCVLLLAGCGGGAGAPAAPRGGPAAPRGGPVPSHAVPARLVAEARPIGHAPAFHPPATGPVPGRCRARVGARYGVHVEVFARNRVVLLPRGLGVRAPWHEFAGRIAGAACYGDLVTLDPTGVVLVRRGAARRLADVFRAWGEPLSESRLAGFAPPPGGRVRTFLNGRPWAGPPASVPLAEHAEIVLEVGPYVPPHVTYTFPPGA